MTLFGTSLFYSGLAAGADLLGGAIITAKSRVDGRFLRGSLAVGTGFMLAATLLDIIPASLQAHDRWLPLLILAGYLLVLMAQRAAALHPSSDGGHDHHHPHGAYVACEADVQLPLQAAISALVGFIVHTFFDGVAIGAGFQVTPSLGVLVFLAVILHKLPEGLTMASIVLSAGGRRRDALGAAAIIGGATVLGTALTDALSWHFGRYALAASGGVMLFVAASDLVPEVTRTPGSRRVLLMLAGVAIYALSNYLLHAAGLP